MNFQPNSDLENLPIFDRTGWIRVHFGDIVENVNETERESMGEGIERFIGLEHLEPGSLHIRTWGNVADGTTFTRRCRPGQVLFGKRRAYQRKVAVAEFDAVVSGDIYVFAPKDDRLMPELLPFICLSERFFQYAVETSAGSLSPRTNWKHLAEFEFDLPPLDQQRRIAEVLWAADEAEQNYGELLSSVKNFYKSQVSNFFFIASAKNKNGLFKPEWPTAQLQQIIQPDAPIRYGIVQVGANCDNGVPTVAIKDLSGDFSTGVHRTSPAIESQYLGSRIRSGDLLLSIKATVGEVAVVPDNFEGNISRDLARIRCNSDLDPRLLLHLFRSDQYRSYINKYIVGSTRKEISIHLLRKFEVPLPPKCESMAFMSSVTELESVIGAIQTNIRQVATIKHALIDRIHSESS